MSKTDDLFQELYQVTKDSIKLVHKLIDEKESLQDRIDELEQQLALVQAENEEYHEKEYSREIDELMRTRGIW